MVKMNGKPEKAMSALINTSVQPVSAALVIQGITSLVRRNFASALVNLWTASEQCIEKLWDAYVLSPAQRGIQIEGRLDQLRDSRTWTSSTKIELLYQKGLIDVDSYSCISVARKGRNKLVHNGLLPNLEVADAAADGAMRLLSIVSSGTKSATCYLGALAHFREKDSLRNPDSTQVFRREDFRPEGGYFVRLPPIPGEKEWTTQESKYPYSVTVMQCNSPST